MQEEMAAVSQAHWREKQEEFSVYMQRIQAAATAEERARIQAELQEAQKNAGRELQDKMAAIAEKYQ